MTFKLSALCSVISLGVALVFSVPAYADNAAAKTKDELIREGFRCVVVATGFVECTKSGEKAWWCSGQTCEMAPRTTNPRGPNPRIVNPNTMTMSQ